MRAGRLRHKITIQKATESQDAYGEADETWSTFRIVRAYKKVISGTENFVNDKRSPDRIVEFGIHYIDDVTPKMRIKHGTDIFNILSVDNVMDLNRDLILRCHEAV